MRFHVIILVFRLKITTLHISTSVTLLVGRMNIQVSLIIGIVALTFLVSVPSFAVDTYELRGSGISLDSSPVDPTLYKSSLHLEFTSLSEVSKGSVILRSQDNTIAARMIADDWHISYNADGSFIGSGPVRTLQNTYYDMTIQGERKYVANNWSMWEAVGELKATNQEKYSLRFVITGDDRFSATPTELASTVVIPTGNAYEQESTSYIPEKLTVFRGTTVTWVNHDSVVHTVQSQDGKGNVVSLFNSDVLQPGQEFSYKFDSPGDYNYLCTIHPWRTGTILVV